MNTLPYKRKPSIWRPIKPRSFLVPEGSNVLKAPSHSRGHESPLGGAQILTPFEIRTGLQLPNHKTAVPRFHSFIYDWASGAGLKRIIKKSVLIILFGIASLFLIMKAVEYSPFINAETQEIKENLSAISGRASQSLSSKNIKRTVTDASLRFFRMDK